MLSILISTAQKNLHVEHAAGPIEFGRGAQREGVRRVPLEDTYVSRDHLRVEELPGACLRLENLSQRLPVTLDDGRQLAIGSTLEVNLPVKVTLGQTVIIVARPGGTVERAGPPSGEAKGNASPDAKEAAGLAAEGFQTIATPVVLPRPGQKTFWLNPPPRTGSGQSPSLETLAQWMETVLALQRSSASPAEFYRQTAQAMIDLIGLDVAFVLLYQGKAWRVVARSSERQDDPDRPLGREFSQTVLAQILTEKRTFYQDLGALKGQESLRNVNAVVASPIFGRQDDVVGAVYGLRLGQPVRAEVKISALEAQLVQLLACAVSANQARMTATQIERDLEIGRSIQTSFLPESLPQLPGWEIGAHFDPAREVSGDFYDVFPIWGNQIALVIADVCNKGVGAALFMTLFRSLLRAFAQQSLDLARLGWQGDQPGGARRAACRRRSSLLADLTALSTVELTNLYVARTHADACMFATLFFGVLDTTTGALTYVNAGHDSPVVIGPTGIKARLGVTGPVVGVNIDATIDIERTQLEPGDTLFAYTDGVTELRNPAGQFFTEKKLLSLLERPAPSATALLNGVVAQLREYIAGGEPFDDVTILTVRRAP